MMACFESSFVVRLCWIGGSHTVEEATHFVFLTDAELSCPAGEIWRCEVCVLWRQRQANVGRSIALVKCLRAAPARALPLHQTNSMPTAASSEKLGDHTQSGLRWISRSPCGLGQTGQWALTQLNRLDESLWLIDLRCVHVCV